VRNQDVVTIEDEDGFEIQLPMRWEICSTCQGEGHHARHIDGNGITSSEWAEWDCDERETYLSGGYDRTCGECDGDGKVRVVDEHALDEKTSKLWREHCEAEADYEAMAASERRYGA
jgi:DnaJ-class molecular chaperone